MKKWKYVVGTMCLWLAFGASAMAQEREMPDGQKFDAEFYAAAYPDVTAEIGTAEADLYQHYVTYGKAEGRKAYATDQPVVNKTLLCTKSSAYDTLEDRRINVELAADRINGIILTPGSTFSFSKSVGTRTKENGYVVAESFASGRKTTSVGGGICQVSSTLYCGIAESLPAQIKVTERHKHSALVDYVPENMDATIAEGSLDFQFQNVGTKNLQIVTSCDQGIVTTSVYEIN